MPEYRDKIDAILTVHFSGTKPDIVVIEAAMIKGIEMWPINTHWAVYIPLATCYNNES